MISNDALVGRVVESIGAEYGKLWADVLLLTTGNKGWDTGTGGVDEGNPGGTTCEGWSVGDAVDGKGGRGVCTGKRGDWPYAAGPGGTGTAECGGYQGCGRGGIGQPAGGMGTAEPYLQSNNNKIIEKHQFMILYYIAWS